MKIKKKIIERIISHARQESPIEACGYLAASGGIITHSYPLTNVDKAQEHFSFLPKEQFATMRDAREKGLEICAVYHSHPVSPARPSAEDIKLANDPALLYVIVSLAGKIEDIQAFSIKNQRSELVNLEVINDDRV